ncbi:SLATT domain-containing protein [Rhodovulum sulfidophilum]|uniref:SLATT domain-containing protein n=1 Tax=Rhodovulum sulfidophilum TaxID=35806 RepID=UPI0019274EC5|nr:SLATT domain-containing protein [Rhodovulum sulfidophilum]MBL3587705.1 SLATT domain-containing protein [Rhodovulum sulfidophilum]
MTEQNNLKQLYDRIWITERCHMNAEKRSRFLELYFHIVLALFALSSICISVVGGTQNVRLSDSILSFASITTLCLSLLIFGFKFGETAANHRSCYLALQKLRANGEQTIQKQEEAYIEVLGHYPNHTTGDYMRLAVSNIFQAEQSLKLPNGEAVQLGCWRRLSYAISWLTARLVLVVFAALPFVVVFYGIDFNGVVTP